MQGTEPLLTVWGWFSPTEVTDKPSCWRRFDMCSQNGSIFKSLQAACLQAWKPLVIAGWSLPFQEKSLNQEGIIKALVDLWAKRG